jgi:hypothetical protein
LAQAVGNVASSVPGVNSSSVLVTDKEIFVGVNNQAKDKKAANAKVRMNALSVSPRWFRVYVTDNPSMIQEMNRVATHAASTSSARYDGHVDKLIRSFGGHPSTEMTKTHAATR